MDHSQARAWLDGLRTDPLFSLKEVLRTMLAEGLDEPVENLIVDRPYLVFLVARRDRDVFVLLDGFKLIRLPQRLHGSFEQLAVLATFDGSDFFPIRFTGSVNNAKPAFLIRGGGFRTYV